MFLFRRKQKPTTQPQEDPARVENQQKPLQDSIPKCPYCGFVFETPVTRKRNCPSCKQTIYQRFIEGQTFRQLMTGEQYEEYQKELEQNQRELKINEIAESFKKVLKDNGFSVRDTINHLKGWEQKVGTNRSTFDYYWSTLNELLATRVSQMRADQKSDIYYLMSQIAQYEGRSSLTYDKEWITLNAVSGTMGIECKFEVVVHEYACPECKKYEGRLFTAKELMKEKPVPVTNCTCEGRCDCWISVLP